MTGKHAQPNAFLRLVSGDGTVVGSANDYQLPPTQEVVLGRDPNCQVVLDAIKYRMVSRRHAVIRPQGTSPDGRYTWLLCDANSANGTYLNGIKLEGCQELQSGDRISLAHDGPQFLFEYSTAKPNTLGGVETQLAPANSLSASAFASNSTPLPQSDPISLTQLFPIISTGKDLTSKAYLIPGIFTVIFVVFMFATVGQARPHPIFNTNNIVGTYIASAAYYFIYRLCGKHKPWWVIVAVALSTIIILKSPILNLFIFVFRDILPGNLPSDSQRITLTELLVRMFFGAGLMEELLKAIPIIAVYLIARILPSPWRERIGVWEPLDGILLGTASAVGFALLETLGQYVPQIAQTVAQQAGSDAGQLVGLQLLIPRILGLVAGHMAYSGYLGYFIGLAVLKPSYSPFILLIGYFTASALHALWNVTGYYNALLLIFVGVITYAFFMAAILKARALSPNRAQNFATRFLER